MEFLLKPGGAVEGTARVPGDKSISHRALIVGALSAGSSRIYGLLNGADTRATAAALRALGVEISGGENLRPDEPYLHIAGVGLHGLRAPTEPLDLGNSGTALRLLTGVLAGQRFASRLQGDESLNRRPMQRILTPLAQMGADITATAAGTPPLVIAASSGLQGIEYPMPLASAQLKSCVLLAGLFAQGTTEVTEPAPTRDHTEHLLRRYGYPVQSGPGGLVSLEGGAEPDSADIEIHVPADISSAAFWLVAASIAPGSDLLLTEVGINPQRTGIIGLLERMGANIELEKPRDMDGEPVADLRVRSPKDKLHGIEISQSDIVSAIDEFPALFIAAACAEGRTRLRGAAELRVKESDRIAGMAQGLAKLGVTAKEEEDGIVIDGFGPDGSFGGGEIDSLLDHRIAMSFAIASLRSREEIRIRGADTVATSFPGFVTLAKGLGLNIEVKH